MTGSPWTRVLVDGCGRRWSTAGPTRADRTSTGRVGLGIQRLRGHRPRARRPADLQRGRLGRRRPQRRDLQLPRAARRAAAGAATASHAAATPRSSSTSTRSTAPTASPPARHVRLRAVGRAPPAAAARARPRRQEAAVLRAARRRRSASPPRCGALLQDTDDPARASTTWRSTATSRSATCPAPLTRSRGVRKLPAGAHARHARRQGHARALLAARLRAQARRAPSRSSCERIREGLLRRDAPPAHRRRPARRLPLGRHRLLGRRGRDGRAARREPVRTFSIGFDHERFDELPHARQIAQPVRDRARGVPGPRRTRSRSCRRSCATTASPSRTRRRSRPSTSPS